MFVATWLHALDGRALYYVAVPVPMPTTLAFASLTFDWNAAAGRYQQRNAMPGGCHAVAPAGTTVSRSMSVDPALPETPLAAPEQYPTLPPKKT